MSNKQNIGYNSQDFLSVLKYMKKEHAQDFLTWNDKMNSLLGDYAPDLKAERAVFKRMMQRGILKKFAQADGQDTDKKNRVIKECEICLVQEEFLVQDKVKYYLQVLVDVYGWGMKISASSVSFICDFKEDDVKKLAEKFRKVVDTSSQKYFIWMDEQSFMSSFLDIAPELKNSLSLLRWLYQVADMDLTSMIKNLGNTSKFNQNNLRMQISTIQMKLIRLSLDENAVSYILASILESFQIKYKDYLELKRPVKKAAGGTGGTAGGSSSAGTNGTGKNTAAGNTQTKKSTTGSTGQNVGNTIKNASQNQSKTTKNISQQSTGKNAQTSYTTGSYSAPVKKKKKKWLWIIIVFCVLDFFAMRFMMSGPDEEREKPVKQEHVHEEPQEQEDVAEATETPIPTPSGPDYDYNPETTGITETFDIDLGSSAQEQPYRMNVMDRRTYREFIGYDDFCFKYPHSVYTDAEFVNNGQGEDIQITFTSKHEASSMFVQSCSLSASGYTGALAEIKNKIKEEEFAKMTNVSVVEDMTDMSECRFYLSGYEAGTGLYMYDAVTVKENRIYRMVIKFPSGELDAIRFFYADTMYRLCKFTGGGVQEVQSYDDFCKKLGVSSELTFMSGGVPR